MSSFCQTYSLLLSGDTILFLLNQDTSLFERLTKEGPWAPMDLNANSHSHMCLRHMGTVGVIIQKDIICHALSNQSFSLSNCILE